MKLILKIFLFLCLALSYGITVTYVYSNKTIFAAQTKPNTESKGLLLETISALDKNLHSETVNILNKVVPQHTTRVLISLGKSLTQKIEELLQQKSVLKITVQELILPALKKPDIVYPFHYFW